MVGEMGKGNDNEVMIDDRLLIDDNTSIAVGFRDEKSVKAIEDIILKVFKKREYERQKNNKDIINQMEKQEKAAQKRHEENQKNDKSADVENQLKKLNAEEKSRTKIIEAYLKTFIGVVSQAYSKSLKSSITLAETFRKIDQSGVTVVGGMDAVTKSAYNLGMSYDEITANLSKLSPVIAKLNGTMGNGVKVYEKSLMSIPKSLSLSHEEQNAIFEATMSGMTASQLKSINSQDELNKRVVDTAKEMKLLKMATGKSIEALKEEQNARMQEARFKQFEASYGKSTMDALKGYFSDEEIDYILSGGVKNAGKMALQLANDPGARNIFSSVMNMINQKGSISAQDMTNIIGNNASLIMQNQSNKRAMVRDVGQRAAMSMSDSYEALNAGLRGDQFLSKWLNQTVETVNANEGNRQSQEMLNNAQRYKEGWNKWDVAWTDAQSGRTEGASKLLGMSGKAVNMGADATWWVNEHTGDGVMKALAASATKEALPRAGEWLMAKGSQAFASLFGGSKFDRKQKDKAIHNMDKNVEKVVELLEEGLNTKGGQGSQSESSAGKTIGTFVSGMASSWALWKWKPIITGMARMALPLLGGVAAGAAIVATIGAASYAGYNYYTNKAAKQKTDIGIQNKMTPEDTARFMGYPEDIQRKILDNITTKNMTAKEAMNSLSTEDKQRHDTQTGDLVDAMFRQHQTAEIKYSPRNQQGQTSESNNQTINELQSMNKNIQEMTTCIKNISDIQGKTYRNDVLTPKYPTTTVPQPSY